MLRAAEPAAWRDRARSRRGYPRVRLRSREGTFAEMMMRGVGAGQRFCRATHSYSIFRSRASRDRPRAAEATGCIGRLG